MVEAEKSSQNRFEMMFVDIAGSVRRFPVEVVIAAIFTLFHVFEYNKYFKMSGDETARFSFALISGFLWTLSISLIKERYELNKFKAISLTALGLILIAALHIFPHILSFHFYLFLPVIALFLGLAPYIFSKTKEAEFWLFNHHLWLGAGLALLGGVLFAAGLSVILKTVQELFGIYISRDLYQDFWIIGMGYVFPLAWLSFIPDDFDEAVVEGKQTEFTSSAIAVIVKFILVPLLLIYTAILYVYAVKIGIDGELPKGRIGPMVLTYGAVGAITILFAFPTRYSGGPLITFFWRYWFALTIVPILLLSLAVYQRIDQYGWTMPRYLVAMAGIWLSILAIVYTIKRENRNFRLIIGSLCIFLFIASMGPWGARNVGATDQTNRLVNLLEKNGLLKDGKVIPISDESSNVSVKDARQMRSIISYLSRQNELNRLALYFEGVENSPFPIKDNSRSYKNRTAITKILGLQNVKTKKDSQYVSYYKSRNSNITPISGYSYMAGPIYLNASLKSCEALKKKGNSCITTKSLGQLQNGKKLSVQTTEDSLRIVDAGDVIAEYEIADMLKKVSNILETEKKQKAKNNKSLTKRGPILFKADNAKYPVGLLVENINGRFKDNKLLNYGLNTWVFVGEATAVTD